MEKIDKAIEILQAYKEGKKLEMRFGNGDWFEWNNLPINLFDSGYEYRIKPQPTYRPYTSAEEFLKASKEHGPYLQRMRNAIFRIPIGVGDVSIIFDDNISDSYKILLKDSKWQDGTPCGILIKEEL